MGGGWKFLIGADFFDKVCFKRNADPDSYRDGFNGLGTDFFWDSAWRQTGAGFLVADKFQFFR